MKYIRILMFIFLIIPTYTVFAKPENMAVTLVEVRNDSRGGIIFVFQVNEKIPKSDLNNGFVQVQGGDSYGLHCNQIDESRVQCSTSKKTSGKNVVIGFAGATFWAYVPEIKPTNDCYKIYDWDSNTPSGWALYGVHCQPFAPEDGDEINWNNPYLYPPYIYWYSSAPQPSWCSWGGLGPGYYYYYCPD
ncbi:MAG: hypothetical protein JNM46_06095 [Anaerolineales bacterium]|nr:hypothetical protein [Anaerolineales bacterium]